MITSAVTRNAGNADKFPTTVRLYSNDKSLASGKHTLRHNVADATDDVLHKTDGATSHQTNVLKQTTANQLKLSLIHI